MPYPSLLMADSSDSVSESNSTVYSLMEVAKHSTTSSCWIVIHRKVYDVTNFVEKVSLGQFWLTLHLKSKLILHL